MFTSLFSLFFLVGVFVRFDQIWITWENRKKPQTKLMIVMITSLPYSQHKACRTRRHQQMLFLCCRLLRNYQDWVYFALPTLFQLTLQHWQIWAQKSTSQLKKTGVLLSVRLVTLFPLDTGKLEKQNQIIKILAVVSTTLQPPSGHPWHTYVTRRIHDLLSLNVWKLS